MGEQPSITPDELKEQKGKMQAVNEDEMKEMEERKKQRAAELEKIKKAMENAAKPEDE